MSDDRIQKQNHNLLKKSKSILNPLFPDHLEQQNNSGLKITISCIYSYNYCVCAQYNFLFRLYDGIWATSKDGCCTLLNAPFLILTHCVKSLK